MLSYPHYLMGPLSLTFQIPHMFNHRIRENQIKLFILICIHMPCIAGHTGNISDRIRYIHFFHISIERLFNILYNTGEAK